MATAIDTQWTDRLASIMPANFTNGANVVNEFEANTAIIDTMINRIGQTWIAGAPNAYNPFRAWTRPVMDYGDTIQSYFLPYIEARKPDFAPENPNPFKRVENEVIAQYATINDALQYKQTIQADQLRKAFISSSQFGNFTAGLMDQIYKSVGLDEYFKWVKYLSTGAYAPVKDTVEYDGDIADREGTMAYGAELLTKLKDYATTKLRYPSSDYNVAGTLTSSPALDIIITSEAKNAIDASLSGVYNVDYLRIPGVNWIEVDSFGTVTSTGNKGDTVPTGGKLDAIVMSRGMAFRTPRTPNTGALWNPESLYTNYWYTEESVYAFDMWENAVQIYRKDPPVNPPSPPSS